MLASTERLSRTAFSKVFQVGRRLHTAHLTGIVLPSLTFKAAVVVSKKVAKKAHERNKLRRRLYACIQEVQRTTGTIVWCVIIAKPALARATKRQMAEIIKNEIALIVNSQ